MSISRSSFTATLALLLGLPSTLLAHRQWMLPSSTVLSSPGAWITVDAAVSNELFHFDHVPLRLANLRIHGPDGAELQPQNAATGKYRSTFDVHLAAPGTYRVAMVSTMMTATWMEAGERKTWRGQPAEFAGKAPAAATEVKTSLMNSRVETFVTAGTPSGKALEPTGIGLELAPVTHPNDLVAGQPATFQMLLNGKPAAGLEVTVIHGGTRYRDQSGEMKLRTDADGRFTCTFKSAGMYWLNATTGAGRPGGTGGSLSGPPAGAPGQPRMPEGDRSSYTATLEVLPE